VSGEGHIVSKMELIVVGSLWEYSLPVQGLWHLLCAYAKASVFRNRTKNGSTLISFLVCDRHSENEPLFLIDAQDRSIKHLEQGIERHLSPFEEQVRRCERINGVSRHVLYVLMAEVGTDMQRFRDAEHLSSWAGVCHGHKESAGKQLNGGARQSVCAGGVGAGRARRSSFAHLPGGTVSSAEETAWGKTSSIRRGA
jgi:hypothetical protein